MSKIVCFGELLLRMGAPGAEKLLQTPRLDVCVGGAEANVAVSLAQFGHDAVFASVVTDNVLGASAIGELRRHGVNIANISRTPGRMGLYFLSSGAVLRASEIVYDRADSAFATMGAEDLDWAQILDGASFLHISGITPAVGPGPAEAALRAVKAAKENGIGVSFDGNYRAQLWQAWSSDGPAILKDILRHATIAFINERDIGLIFGRKFSPEDRKRAYSLAFREFPRLKYIANTSRTLSSVREQTLWAEIRSRDKTWESKSYALSGIVDRIGAGDAFAAGVLHALEAKSDPAHAVEFGMAASVIKHSVPGDFNLVSSADVEALMDGGSLDVKR
ncbi:MAG: 2-keto-3-deoxygluconate kinase [Robiginitomaculum sp.]|nr:MAG: 2-keto-3-deoxygluconate kinase [Robiginitomaculum sp.]